ncbi:DUF7847 domain-containing protein [Halopiger djelfimassiliensis]|uniref:DUF7847 domain-containing protein n=1 Tax=Halopiger djelfimassiliensis TaxID=1293047 RepID=UPI000677B118|nr:hypothetical protein [Halopiger djelfimassiliensis]
MTVLAAFKDGWTALRTNPVLLVAGFFVATVSQFQTVGDLTDSAVVDGITSLGYFLAFPFVIGGFIGMALEAVRGSETSFGRFLRAGRQYYLRMLVATVLFAGIAIAAVFGLSPVVTAGGVVWVFGLERLGESIAFGIVVLSFGLYVLSLLFFLMFVQFYDTAIVVEDTDATESLSRSVDVVRSHLRSVLPFSLLWIFFTNTLMMPEALFWTSQTGLVPQEILSAVPDVDPLFAVPVSIAVVTVTGTYLYTTYTAFYLRLVPEISIPADGPASDALE